MAFTNLILFLKALFPAPLVFLFPSAPSLPPPSPFPHFHPLFFFSAGPTFFFLSSTSLPMFSVPLSITLLCLSPFCITLSQPNGITSEHVSLSLLSTIPPLIAEKLMKWSTRMTPSSHPFLIYSFFIPSSQSPLFLNIFILVSLLFSSPDFESSSEILFYSPFSCL